MVISRIKQFHNKKNWTHLLKSSFWFFLGAVLGFFFFISFLYIYYKQSHTNLVYEGVMVNGIDFGGKTKEEVSRYFADKNDLINKTTIVLTAKEGTATISAQQIGFNYDKELLAHQAFSVGRADNTIANMSLMLQAYMEGINLPPSYHYADDRLAEVIAPLEKKIAIKPTEPLFTVQNGKVVTFQLAKEGRGIDKKKLTDTVFATLLSALLADKPQTITLPIPIIAVQPINHTPSDLGIKELIAQGTSLFQHSIENRVFNVSLAASRLNGVLIPPGQTFSFTKTIGDVSTFTGYKQAYVIENGKTVLGDGGGVCQVSTTLFRAALNAGLPIVERNPHAYRVGYYEQDSGPGIDAAIYSPSVDLKFKNDTGHHILIQTTVDLTEDRLTFSLYGTKDNREVFISKPVVTSETPAPETLYQDDPTLPKGEVKQVDFAADGANVYFTRTVKKDGKALTEKFSSNYRPWQAIYLRGTKE